MLLNFMIHTAVVERSTVAAGTTSSAETYTWAVQFPSVACMIQPMSAGERLAFDRSQHEISHTMYYAGVIGILPRDRVLFQGRIFSVKGVRNIVHMDRLMTFDLKEETGVDGF